MNHRLTFNLLGILCLATACAVSSQSSVVIPPEFPAAWTISINQETDCPDLTGVFDLTPEVAVLQQSGTWQLSKGNWFDYVLLLPIDQRIDDDLVVSNDSGKYIDNSLAIKTVENDELIQIISPVNNTNDFVLNILDQRAGDFECKDGSIIFPQSVLQGGTEGSFLEGTVLRSLTITRSGDLLFYELIRGQKESQKYFLFRKLSRY